MKKLKKEKNWRLNFDDGKFEYIEPSLSTSPVEYVVGKHLCTNYFVYEEYPELPLSINFLMLVAFQKTKYYEVYESMRKKIEEENKQEDREGKTPEISSCFAGIKDCQYARDSKDIQAIITDYSERVFNDDYVLLSLLT